MRSLLILRALFLAATLAMVQILLPAMTAAADMNPLVFFGTYTGAKSRGVYVSRFDVVRGKLTAPRLAAEMRNPSFLVVHPNGEYLYAVGEVGDFGAEKNGVVVSFRIDRATGQLSRLNEQPSGGSEPCHLAIDPSAARVLVANYGSGSIAAFPVKDRGELGAQSCVVQHRGSSANPQRQEGPHAHFITPDPAKRFALVCDLGLDQVLLYRLDKKSMNLTANEPPFASLKPGSGPRHLVFHPNGRYVYVINEMASSVTVFGYDAQAGRLSEVETVSTLPNTVKGENSCAEVQIHPSGKFLYGSNRGHNSLARFAVDPKTGKLTFLDCQPSGGKTPRHFAIDPSGRWLLSENQDSDNVLVFRIDAADGRLQPTGESIEVGAPVCAVFAP
jgi:6-phosphogluconolactonase